MRGPGRRFAGVRENSGGLERFGSSVSSDLPDKLSINGQGLAPVPRHVCSTKGKREQFNNGLRR